MSKNNDGGPAFPNVPTEVSDQCTSWDMGMSLRDYFAGQALALVITEGLRLDQVQGMATRAYQIADAMLAERKKRKGGEA